MDLLQTAWILLALRLLSVAIILYIIFKITLPNLTAKNDKHVKPVRWVLFFISIALLAGNLIPVIVDIGSIIGAFARSTNVLSTAGAVYSLNNAMSHLVYSIGFLFLFIISGQVNTKLNNENKELQDDAS